MVFSKRDRWLIAIGCLVVLGAIIAVVFPFVLRDQFRDRDFARQWIAELRLGEDTSEKEGFAHSADPASSMVVRAAIRAAEHVSIDLVGGFGSGNSCFSGKLDDGHKKYDLVVLVGHRSNKLSIDELALDAKCSCPERASCSITR